MTAYPTWTPAPRPGIIPLRPLGFGTILGRSFAALRQNPRVLLGFALVVQAVATLIVVAAVGGASVWALSRVATLQPGTEEFDTVMAGSVALIVIATLVLSLGAAALGVIVQGVVVSEVAHAAVAEKLPLGRLWRRVKPVAWRLVGWTLLVTAAVTLAVGILIGLVVALSQAGAALAIVFTVLAIIGAIPLYLWLAVKLLLVPATIVLEHATIRVAVARSWHLTRGRFWSTLGIIVLVSLTFGVLAQAVTVPFTFLSLGMTTIFTPTGEPDAAALITLLVGSIAAQVLTVLVQAVALVVQATATSLIYIDCRMRHEGLDLDLLAYVESRDAGATDLPDPYRQHIGRDIGPRWGGPSAQTPPMYGVPPYGAPTQGAPAYGASVYGAPAYGAPSQGMPPYGAPPQGMPPYGATPQGGTPHGATPQGTSPHEAPSPAPAAPPTKAPTEWTAPGADGDAPSR